MRYDPSHSITPNVISYVISWLTPFALDAAIVRSLIKYSSPRLAKPADGSTFRFRLQSMGDLGSREGTGPI